MPPLRSVGSLGALALGIVLAMASLVAAQCRQTFAPVLLTPSTTSLPRDGGALVLGMRLHEGDGRPMPAAIQLTRRRTTQALAPQVLAPGLVRFAAPARLGSGSFTTTDLGPVAATVAVGRSPLPGVPTRPVVREMRRVAAAGVSTAVAAAGAPRMEIRGLLEFPVPAGIVAIITSWAESGPAAWWRPAVQGQTEIVVWTEPAGCPDPEGSLPPPTEGGLGRIAFVDAFGQVSPASSPVPIQ